MHFPFAFTSVALKLQVQKECKNHPGGVEADTKFENCCPRQKCSLIQSVVQTLFLQHSLSKVMEHCNWLKAGFLEVAMEINFKGMQEKL